MLKMFTTQLTGLFGRLHKEEMEIENAARLLAQATVGDGSIYIKGFGEMAGVTAEALQGEEPLEGVRELHDADALTVADRVLLVTRRSTDPQALAFAKKLTEAEVPFAVIAGKVKDAESDLEEKADSFLNTQTVRSMLPDETGGRFGFPSLMAALYLYHGVKFVLDEILEDY
ncbi:hypothetical protein KP77_29620 [Jeotgalibacillus alimentarius]|uniref:DUF2529 domain-containing protein n=1 Tax=Jeotgalibacillus alimentarius TaxID=135826 RepID=A0A0C2VJ56_9BACL|nr:DUF2529 family protein [Jeotgalibacillus alimentarius]KIL44013.1 hypothetical protein KP77_29620 [Jeotgalibacillus alimentarius]